MSLTGIPQTAIAHYDIERVLGRGSMGVVYLARDRRIGRRVALKMISVKDDRFDAEAPGEFYVRLQREAEVCGSLLHPNIVALYEVGYEKDRISWLAMEYIEGENLLDRIKRATPQPLDPGTAIPIIKDVLRALAYAHGKNIVHRDIKPENILIATDGTAKIADFGIARPQNSSLTTAGAMLGTPSYMSPEQVLGQTPTPKADIFSTGVMIFEMLTAGKPFAAPDLTGMLHNILRQPVLHISDLNPAVPRPVGDVVARMLEKKPDDRPDASAILEALSVERQPSPAVERRAWMRGAPGIAAAIGVVLIAAGLLVVTRQKPQTPPTTTQSAPPAPPAQQKSAEGLPQQPVETTETGEAAKEEPKRTTKRAQRRKPNWLRRIQKVFRH